VVVKYVVTESGEVTNVKVVRGHPMFDAAVLAAVRTWRFKPAALDGRPIAIFRVARFPFKLKT
jgi:protein TonB